MIYKRIELASMMEIDAEIVEILEYINGKDESGRSILDDLQKHQRMSRLDTLRKELKYRKHEII